MVKNAVCKPRVHFFCHCWPDGILIPSDSGLPNRMFLTNRHGESMHQRVRRDEEINVSELSGASSISAKARPHTGTESHRVNLPEGNRAQPLLIFEGLPRCQQWGGWGGEQPM